MNDGYGLVVEDVHGNVSVGFASLLNPDIAEIGAGADRPSLGEVLCQRVDVPLLESNVVPGVGAVVGLLVPIRDLVDLA